MEPMKREILFTKEVIEKKVWELAETISRDYQGGELIVIGVLKGAFVFMADLIRSLSISCLIDFVKLASYGAGSVSSGKVMMTKDIEISMEGKDVLIVEDIVDTGLTLSFLVNLFRERNPRSVKVCALLDKRQRREVPFEADYVGFTIEDGFVVGYGIDFNEEFRYLPEIYIIENMTEERNTFIPFEEREDLDDLQRDVEQIRDQKFGEEGEEGNNEKETSRLWSPWKLTAYIVIAVLILSGVFLWFFPGIGEQAWERMSLYIPWIENIVGTERQGEVFDQPRVQLKDIKQRFVNNLLLGNLRVIEGTAVNSSDFPIAGIRVRGRLYDAYAMVAGEQVSYCGNYLIDEELGFLTEDEIQRELSNPRGSDVSNNRITPHGQIPFMIVFCHWPGDVFKTTVTFAGAERLLE